ncbi:MAG: NAD-dependent epimerase/dehydratase family protein [Phycisphaerales bacterium]
MKVCVTGGSGFIGSYVCEALRARGDQIAILDLIEPPAVNVHDTFVQGDVRDRAACDAAFAGCDMVIHLAAAHHDFGIEEKTYFDVNEGAAKVMGDAMDDAGTKNLVFYSTVALYGEGNPPLTETSAPQPNSPYGASKLGGEKVFDAWTQRGDGRRALVIRPTVTFGPRNFANVYSLIRQIHGGKYVTVGPATNIKSLSYVENIVACTFFLMGRDDLPAFDVYNWVEKPDMTSRQIAETIHAAMDKQMSGLRIPMWSARLAALPFDAAIAVTGKNIPISTARIKKLFETQTKFEADKARAAGFEPVISLEEGLTRMVKWYMAGGKDESADWHQPPAEVVAFARAMAGQS